MESPHCCPNSALEDRLAKLEGGDLPGIRMNFGNHFRLNPEGGAELQRRRPIAPHRIIQSACIRDQDVQLPPLLERQWPDLLECCELLPRLVLSKDYALSGSENVVEFRV